jgi:ketosteroid isomerase-like protein
MSEENVEKVLRGYEAWNRRDFDAAITVVDPEIDWIMVGATRFPGTDAAYHGHAGVREFWRIFIEPWEEFAIEVKGTRTTGDRVVAFVEFHAKAREGLELATPFVHLFTFRGGKAIQFQSFDDRDEALEAAGLSEEDAASSPS